MNFKLIFNVTIHSNLFFCFINQLSLHYIFINGIINTIQKTTNFFLCFPNVATRIFK